MKAKDVLKRFGIKRDVSGFATHDRWTAADVLRLLNIPAELYLGFPIVRKDFAKGRKWIIKELPEAQGQKFRTRQDARDFIVVRCCECKGGAA